MGIYHVRINAVYEGSWWDRGTELWGEFAVDQDDEDFLIPQSTFMQFLAKAQRIPGWESPTGTPVVWNEDNPSFVGL